MTGAGGGQGEEAGDGAAAVALTDTVAPASIPSRVSGEAAAPSLMTKLKSVYISVFIDVLGIGLVIPVLPYLILSFDGAGATEVGLTMAVYSLCQVPGSIIFGAISDKYGRRPVLLLSILSSSLSFLLCAFARNLPFIVFARCVSGLTGGSISVAQAYVADVTTVEDRPKFLGLVGATIGIAFTFGPGIGAGLAAIMKSSGASIQDQYSAVFFLAAFFAFLGFVYAYRNLEESKTFSAAAGAPEVDGGVTTVATAPEADSGVNKSQNDMPNAKAVRSAQAASDQPSISLKAPILIVACAMFATNYAFTVMQSTYGVLIFEEWGWEAAPLGAILVVSGLEIAVLQAVLIKKLVARTGKHVAAVLSCVMLGAGLALLPLTLRFKLLHFVCFALHVAGFSIGQTSQPALLSRFASNDDQGKSLGLGQAFQAASRVVAPIVSGVLFDESEALIGVKFAAPYLLGGIVSVLSGIPLLMMLAKTRLQKAEAGEAGGIEMMGAGGSLKKASAVGEL